VALVNSSAADFTSVLRPSASASAASAARSLQSPALLSAPQEYRVKKSGVYILLFANCDETMFPDTPFDTNETLLWIEGTSVWMNPYGHLPGRLYGFLPVRRARTTTRPPTGAFIL
jgi:hypothetical protein